MTTAKNILFVHYGDEWIRGSEQLLLDLMRSLDQSRYTPFLWCNSLAMENAAREAGISVHRTPLTYFLDYSSPPFRMGAFTSQVNEGVRLIREHRIDVVHANSAAPAQWMVPAARITRRPILAHLHIGYLRRTRVVCLLHQCTAVVGVSGHVLDELLRDGVERTRVLKIYNGIDFRRLQAEASAALRSKLQIPSDALVVATAGSLIHRKGHDVAIRAVAAVSEGKNIHLLVAGDGPERARYEALAAELGIGHRVYFLGHTSVASVYAAADIFVLASRAEAFGLVLAEAASFGLPVIASNVGGIPEVIEPGRSGILVPPDDVQAVSSAILRLADDVDHRHAMGQAARCDVLDKFDVGRMAARFARLYDRLSAVPPAGLGWMGAPAQATPYLRMILRR